MNRATFIGNLTKDPEIRNIQKMNNDTTVCNFTVAASHGFGEYKHVEYVRVAAWNGIGKTCMQYLKKGSKVFISGPVGVNAYINSDGEAAGNLELRLEEIEFLSSSKPADSVEEPINPDDEDIEDLL